MGERFFFVHEGAVSSLSSKKTGEDFKEGNGSLMRDPVGVVYNRLRSVTVL